MNQSKVRRDHDEWHDVPLPKQLKTEEELQVKTEKVTFKSEEPEEQAVEAASVAHADLV